VRFFVSNNKAKIEKFFHCGKIENKFFSNLEISCFFDYFEIQCFWVSNFEFQIFETKIFLVSHIPGGEGPLNGGQVAVRCNDES
jgi:hypothetical protein